MRIALIEPYYSGSHKAWSDGLIRNSSHEIELFSLQGKNWKWRMLGGAITLADQFNKTTNIPDLILCSDMLDLALFKALLLPQFLAIPIAVYFHENQLCYPFQNKNETDRHYGFINITTAITANYLLFNSKFHQDSFCQEAYNFLKVLPDHRNLPKIKEIQSKSSVLHIAVDQPISLNEANIISPIFLWNHRWEHDKNPELFFNTLFRLSDKGINFRLNVLGESYAKAPSIFSEAKTRLESHIDNWGYLENITEYNKVLNSCNILLVTSNQDFFGISVVEAILHDCYPILPFRLAYPETIPFENYFYKNDSDLFAHTELILNDKKFTNKQTILIDFCKKYYWKNQIEKYDLTLSSFT